MGAQNLSHLILVSIEASKRRLFFPPSSSLFSFNFVDSKPVSHNLAVHVRIILVPFYILSPLSAFIDTFRAFNSTEIDSTKTFTHSGAGNANKTHARLHFFFIFGFQATKTFLSSCSARHHVRVFTFILMSAVKRAIISYRSSPNELREIFSSHRRLLWNQCGEDLSLCNLSNGIGRRG